MRNILILGAGKSSIALIDYLVQNAAAENWHVTVADITEDAALKKTKGRSATTATGFDLNNEQQRTQLISVADIVISMLPAALHLMVATDCLKLKKNLVTPSYISDGMKALGKDVKSAGLIFMNEMGLDPGIDHMSAMQLLDGLKAKGNTIIGFESHCGGLIAPESDTNPWHYKFTWNARNVIVAGQGADKIRYRKNGQLVELSYHQLFASATKLNITGHGIFESYPNRDSLKYIEEYNLNNVATMYRGTLRVPPFCEGWSQLVQWGLTDDNEINKNLNGISFKTFFNNRVGEQEKKLVPELQPLLRSILDDNRSIPFNQATNAQILQAVLEEQWQLKPGDKDMVVMVHQIEFMEGGAKKKLQSSLVLTGKDEEHTAMALTVGLPVAIVTRLILNGQLKQPGVLMPKTADIYQPVMRKLSTFGIHFNEEYI